MRFFVNKKGMSLIEVLVVVGILGIITSAMTSMITNLQNESRALTEKLGALELEKFLISALADGSICTAELTPSVLNGNKAYAINTRNLAANKITLPKGLHSNPTDPNSFLVAPGDQASSLSRSLIIGVGGMTVTDFKQDGINLYRANIRVAFDNAKLVRAIQPLSIKTVITTDNAGTITSCGSNSPSFGGTYDSCTCVGWGRCQGNYLNNGAFSCPPGYTPHLFSSFDDRGKCGHNLFACYK